MLWGGVFPGLQDTSGSGGQRVTKGLVWELRVASQLFPLQHWLRVQTGFGVQLDGIGDGVIVPPSSCETAGSLPRLGCFPSPLVA